MMRRVESALLTLIVICALILAGSVISFAETPIEVVESASNEAMSSESDYYALFADKLYIDKNISAGLDSPISVQFTPLSLKGKVYLPGKADSSKLLLSWNNSKIKLIRNGKTYTSGTAPIAPEGKTIRYKVRKGLHSAVISLKTVKGSSDVEPMFLNIDESLGTIEAMNGDPDHEISCYGFVNFDGNDSLYMSMKGRGNSTWDFPKKPYNLTFYKDEKYDDKKKRELIPGVQSKKWSLLANYLDTALIRNKVGENLASKLGIGLASRFVDVWMNGEYLGNYLLTPKSDYQAPDGGYVIENDNYSSDDPQFRLPGMREPANIDGFHNLISIKDIGDDAVLAGENTDTIKEHVITAWNALRDYNSEDYQNYFDIDSWAKEYLMYEMTKTYDVFSGSLLMHRDGLTNDDKIMAGPAWDMDNSFGRTIIKLLSGVTMYNQFTAEGWYVDSVGLVSCKAPVSILQEFSKHASFKQRMSEIYNDYRDAFEEIVDDIDYQREFIAKSAAMDYERWGNIRLSVYIATTPLVFGSKEYRLCYEPTVSWNNYVNNMRRYVVQRVKYLNDHLGVVHPVGSIVGNTKLQDGDTLELTVSLSSGCDNNSFQWQMKSHEGEWIDLEDATEAKFEQVVDTTLDGTEYRCVVKNSGKKICMTHGKSANASALTELSNVQISVAAGSKISSAEISCQPMYFAIGDSLGAGFGLDGYQQFVQFSKDNHKKNYNFTDVPNSYPSLVKAGLNASEKSLNGTYPSLRAIDVIKILNGKTLSKEDDSYKKEPFIVEMNETGGLTGNNPKYFFKYLNNKTNYKTYKQGIKDADIISVQLANNDFNALISDVLKNPDHPLMIALNKAMQDTMGESFDYEEVQRLLASDGEEQENNLPVILGHIIRIGQEVTDVMNELNKLIASTVNTCIETNTELLEYIKANCKEDAKIVVVGM